MVNSFGNKRKKYVIEKMNGNSFVVINIIDAKPFSSQYNYCDNNPSGGTNYYRLKIVDNDGSVTYSKIVAAIYSAPEKLNISLSANSLNVSYPASSGLAKLSCINLFGQKVIADINLPIGSLRETIKLNMLSAGQYVLLYTANNRQLAIKFIK